MPVKKKNKSLKDRLYFFKKKSSLDFNRKRERIDFAPIKRAFLLIAEIIGSVGLAFIIAFTFFSGFSVSGVSMEPSLYAGNKVLINRLGSIIPIDRDDVVAFMSGSGNNKSVNVKRVVAVPGDSVYISGGKLFVNGEKEVSKDPDKELIPIDDGGAAKNELILSDGEYFLLGDNRNNSEDSRYESIGMIKKSDILGKVWVCYSLSNFGPVR